MHRQWIGAIIVLVLAKLVGLGITAFIFEVTREKLLGMAWFRRIYEWFIWLREWAHQKVEPVAVLAETDQGRFRYEEINPATLRFYNKTREQVIGFTTDEVIGAEKAAEMNAHLRACLRAGAPYRYERTQGNGTVEAIATPVA